MSHTPRVLILFALANAVWAQPAPERLTNAVDVLALPPERSSTGIPVSVTGVVTAAQSDWHGRFFVQDETAGVFVENISDRQPQPGDLVAVSGVTHPGGFAPIISQPHWQKLGTAPLPEAKPVSIGELMAGIVDSQRIEISGIVRAVEINEASVVYQIVSGGYRLRVFTPATAAGDPELLVGTRVRVRGTAATSFHAALRRLVAVNVYVPRPSDLSIEKSNPGDPFLAPLTPLDSVAQYRNDHALGKRIHVRGTVVYQRPGVDLFLQDATGGLRVKSRQLDVIARGRVVEAVGFPDYDQFLPVLDDAVFRVTDEPVKTPRSVSVTMEELQAGLHHAELITIRGRLLDRLVVRPEPQNPQRPAISQVTLTLQTSNIVFTAAGSTTASSDGLFSIPLGSVVELTGICMLHIRMGATMESGDVGTMESFQMFLPTSDSFQILQRPSWLTPKRLVLGLAILSVVLMVAVSWSVTVSRKNSALRQVVREKARAQDALQMAHDQLDERVRERTAQLKYEMNARQEAEVHFKATLAERTRLAQELHDTIEQSLAGIGLQLDTASKLFEKRADGSKRHLELARSLMTQSQVELRRSIWDLRSRELEQFDLPNALHKSAQEILEDTNIRVELETIGQVQRLSEVVEENLLRIGREALTNIIKHAQATRVVLQFEFGPDVVTLRVTDNGRGFSPEQSPGANEGHFGLLGMSERTKRLNGKLRVVSQPGQGTRLEVVVPLRLATKDHTATAADAQGWI